MSIEDPHAPFYGWNARTYCAFDLASWPITQAKDQHLNVLAGVYSESFFRAAFPNIEEDKEFLGGTANSIIKESEITRLKNTIPRLSVIPCRTPVKYDLP